MPMPSVVVVAIGGHKKLYKYLFGKKHFRMEVLILSDFFVLLKSARFMGRCLIYEDCGSGCGNKFH